MKNLNNIKKYKSGISYERCLIPENKEYLIKIKKGILNEEEAVKLAKKVDEETKNIKDMSLLKEDTISIKAIEVLDFVKFEILKRKFKAELIK